MGFFRPVSELILNSLSKEYRLFWCSSILSMFSLAVSIHMSKHMVWLWYVWPHVKGWYWTASCRRSAVKPVTTLSIHNKGYVYDICDHMWRENTGQLPAGDQQLNQSQPPSIHNKGYGYDICDHMWRENTGQLPAGDKQLNQAQPSAYIITGVAQKITI